MKKLLAMFLCALALHINATTTMDPKELILHEIATVKENHDKKYVYLSHDIKNAFSKIAGSSISASAEFDQISSYIRKGGSIVEFDVMQRIMAECQNLIAKATIADETAQKNLCTSIEEYQSALENGQAIITVDDSFDETAQKRTLRITSGLIVVDFVKLYGNLDVTNNIIAGGDLTIEGATYLEGTTYVNNNLLVNGTFSGSSNGTFNSLTVNGPSFLNGIVNVSPSLFINGVQVTPGGGNVVGPASSTDNAIALFSGTTGQLIKQSPAPVTIDGSNNLAGVNTITITGDLNLPATSASTAGVITINSNPFAHAFGGTTNTFAGTNAGNFTLTGTNDTGVGASALNALTSGNQNSSTGSGALATDTTGSRNTADGYNALNLNSTGSDNVATGANALAANTASQNTAVGSSALQANTSGTPNSAFGFNALKANTSGTNNVAAGDSALATNTTGSSNTAVGSAALTTILTGADCTAIGKNALTVNTASQMTAVGSGALAANSSGTGSTAVGFNALHAISTANQCTAMGTSSLAVNTASQNSAFGFAALAANTSGTPNTAVGFNALKTNTNGTNNVAVGDSALALNTASQNTACGSAALAANTSGASNTAVGYNALNVITNGSNCTAVGNQSLPSCTGSSNTAIGSGSLLFNSSGSSNTAVGFQALFNNASGTGNTAIGGTAGLAITGSNNVCVGSSAGSAATSGANNIYIGANQTGVAAEANQIRIGVSGTQTGCFIAGIAGQTISATNATVIVDTSATATKGQLGTVSSSARYKHNIADMGDPSDILSKLHPVTFQWKPERSTCQEIQYGLIAEEVAQVFPGIVNYYEGRPESVRYHILPQILLKAVQTLIKRVDDLETKNAELVRIIEGN